MSNVPPILSLRDVTLSFGGPSLFNEVTLHVYDRDKICVVGRNGCGKSSMLKLITGAYELDGGEIYTSPGLKIHYLPQDPPVTSGKTVMSLFDDVPAYEAQAMLDALKVDGQQHLDSLSGGQRRRAFLAQALCGDPDLLMLDEPTNHLDIEAIEWLEDYLKSFRGAVIMISHDRRFLNNVSNKTWWLEMHGVFVNNKGYENFESWSEEIVEKQARTQEKLETHLRQELHWLQYGVTARRKRNQGRLRKLASLRENRQHLLSMQKKSATLPPLTKEQGGQLVTQVENISKSYNGRCVIQPFTTRILRGDRIGFVGPNGIGKSTLLKMLIGELVPDSGVVQLGTNISMAYCDQLRSPLKLDETPWEFLCPTGGDQVEVQGKPRHVMGYLKDFLFKENQARAPISLLSGGERNRLLLARALAQPSNVLALDEPTNDIDMDTLDLLQELLSEYEGTLLLISHDRDFMERLVTSIIAFEPNGLVKEYGGGYDDYLRYTKELAEDTQPNKPKTNKTLHNTSQEPSQPPVSSATNTKPRLSYNQKRQLDLLPVEIQKLKDNIAKLETKLADPELYKKDYQAFMKYGQELADKKQALDDSENQWLELTILAEELG